MQRFGTFGMRGVNRLLAVGAGEIRTDGPVHVIEEIL